MSGEVDDTDVRGETMDGAAGQHGRRSIIKKAAIAGGVVWAAPTLLSVSPAAAQSLPQPFLVANATVSDFDPPPAPLNLKVRTIDLPVGSLTDPLLPGDIYLAFVAYDSRETVDASADLTLGIELGIPEPATFVQNQNVNGLVYWRRLVAGDIVDGAYTQTFSTGNDFAIRGGLRGSAVVYRTDIGVLDDPIFQGGVGSAASPVAVVFPAIASTTPNVVVRLGAARGRGAVSQNIAWTSIPATNLVNNNVGNSGDRAIVISEETNSAGGTANGSYGTAQMGYWAAFSALITAQ